MDTNFWGQICHIFFVLIFFAYKKLGTKQIDQKVGQVFLLKGIRFSLCYCVVLSFGWVFFLQKKVRRITADFSLTKKRMKIILTSTPGQL